jgi:mannonate dehydratase
MKLGLGLYRHQLNLEHYRFAKQCGCTHLIVHLVDYFRSSRSNRPGDQPVGDDSGWGLAGDADQLWTLAELTALRQEINDAGLEWEAIENFDPAHWHDVLLDGPKKAQQLENLKTIIRNVGKAGIPVFGYNFSIAGVAGRVKGTFARGQAEAVGMDGPLDQPLPNGMAWNMVYDRNPPPGQAPSPPGFSRRANSRGGGSRGSPSPRIPTTRRCRPCAPSHASSISHACIKNSWI